MELSRKDKKSNEPSPHPQNGYFSQHEQQSRKRSYPGFSSQNHLNCLDDKGTNSGIENYYGCMKPGYFGVDVPMKQFHGNSGMNSIPFTPQDVNSIVPGPFKKPIITQN